MDDIASAYRSEGLHPIVIHGVRADGRCTCGKDPCGKDNRSAGKHPTRPGWQKSEPAEAIPEGYNVGLRMGVQPDGRRLLALDEDEPEALARLEAKHGALPPTLTARSGSGGQHRIYTVPLDAKLGNRAKLDSLRLDVKCDAGQIVVAPSVHASGGQYEWTDTRDPAPLPQAWLDLLTGERAPAADLDDIRLLKAPRPAKCPADRDRVEYAIELCRKAPVAIDGAGGGSALLVLLTDLIVGLDLPVDRASDLAEEHYNPRCKPPWDLGTPEGDHEWTHKVAEAELNRLGRTPGDLVESVGFTDSEIAERSRGRQGSWLTDPDAIMRLARLGTADRERVYDEIKVNGCRVMTSLRKAVTEAERQLARERGRRGLTDLRVSDAGKVEASMFNVACILRDSPRFKGRVLYDDFRACALIDGEPLTDRTLQNTCLEIEDEYHVQAQDSLVYKVLKSDAVPHVHPVREYLLGLPPWDGEPWLACLPELFTCEPTDLHIAMFRAWMIGAVARVFEPGCQMDYVLTLQGPEGIGKTGGFRTLIGRDWFHSSMIDLDSKDASIGLAGTWVWELGELEGLSKFDMRRWKQFITDPVDKVRAPYTPVHEARPRQTIFCGSTNDEDFLPQGEDGRRWWAIRCNGPQINREALHAARDMLWSEALHAYRSGERAMLPAELDKAVQECRDDFKLQDPWTQPIADWLTRQSADGVTSQDVLSSALKIEIERQDRRTIERATRCLKSLGWQRAGKGGGRRLRTTVNGTARWLYYPPDGWVFASVEKSRFS